MKNKNLINIFLSSIHQNAGKTTVCLGLYKALKDRKFKTAFLKPIGQQTVRVGGHNIDKDSYLIGRVFHCGRRLKEMSPVTIGRGFTERYIFHPRRKQIGQAIRKSFTGLTRGKEAILAEGTGHAGVGSVIDYSNADVAGLLGSKVIIVSEGGIGRSIDEIMLNKALFDLRGVEVLGVIVNKVLPRKYKKIKKVLGRGLNNKGVRLLGIIPVDPILSAPTVGQIQDRLGLKLLCGKANISRHVQHTIVAAMEPHNMIHYIREGTLVLTSGDRVDNILVAVSSHLVPGAHKYPISAIILTGGLRPNPKIMELLRRSKIPIFITEEDTYTVAGQVEQLICKIQQTDTDKIEEATRLVEKFVDVEGILKSF